MYSAWNKVTRDVQLFSVRIMNITLEFLSKNRAGVLCTLGSFLLSLALSLDYSYPNLNTYVTSYLRKNG